ncbi:hypothetical protein Glove_84g165 [Diversispora epigaea]|uniref:ATPase domain-containing protein n=1 Tax=Diversispora epigaea TaxID=1348612 RepID=A0A397JGG2_9GLOM|nr:hypothetical protein Glove_84g165 [Diversispora epigaea]
MFAFNLIKSFKHLPTSSNCLNILSNSCIACYNTKENSFFNRKRELVKFTNALSGTPELHVILGPPSSGKTALIREITNKGNFNPLFMDCRYGQFNSPTTLYNSIFSQFKLFFENQREILKKIMLETEIKATIPYFFDLKFMLFNKKEKEIIAPNTVINLLHKITDSLPNQNFWTCYNIPPPILIIDEANLFSQLGENSKEEATLLKSFLNWLVINTKQEKHFHVVLTSSDSFFFDWIINILHPLHVIPYVVGDLSKEEAKEYFEIHVLPQYECRELEGKFDHICRLTGTRMLIIDRYVKEYKNSEKKLKDSKFSLYESEYSNLKHGLFPRKLKYLNKLDQSLWKNFDLIKTMEAIVEAEDQGFILEDDLIEMIGSEKVDSLVSYNFLHRRPTSRFANDIIDPPDKLILTAINQSSVRAMEQVLSEVKK